MTQQAPSVRAIWSPRAILGEGPIFDARSGRVLWLDIKGRRLYSCDGEGQNRRTFELPQRLCSLDVPPLAWTTPDTPGEHYLGCGDHGFGWVTIDGDKIITRRLCHPETALASNRFNDGKSGPDGRYWAGTMDDEEKSASGSLYAFSSDGSAEKLDGGYRVTNGPAFGLDGATVLHTDSAAQTIYAFTRMPSGALNGKRVWRQYADGEGYPDGMTTDSYGNVWVALWDGWCVEKLSPQGNVLQKIAVPTARPTSCVFSKAEPNVMFVTSASIGLPESDALAGSLFRIEL